MNMNKQNVTMGNMVQMKDAQVLIEGVLRLPQGLEEINSVLAVKGQTKLLNCQPLDGKVSVEGVVRYTILYVNKQGEICAFDSECTFNHTAEQEGFHPQMELFCHIDIQNTEYKTLDGTSIEIKSVLLIQAQGFGNNEFEVLESMDAAEQMQVKQVRQEVPYLLAAKMAKSYVDTTLRVPQSMPPVKQILMSGAYPIVRNIIKEDGKMVVEGDLRIELIYLSTDKNAPIQFLNETVPFAEIVNESACSEKAQVCVNAWMEEFDISGSEADEDNLAIRGIIHLAIVCYEKKNVALVQDMYTKDREVELKDITMEGCELVQYPAQKKILRIGMSVPAGNPDVSRVLFADACPQVINARAYLDKVLIDGMIQMTICYTTVDAGMKSMKVQLPFETDIQVEGMRKGAQVHVTAFAEYTSIEGSGRELDVKCCLEILVVEEKRSNVTAVCSAAFSQTKVERDPGIVVYFTSQEEPLWDIAKRFRVCPEGIRRCNTDLPENEIVPKGKKIIIIKD